MMKFLLLCITAALTLAACSQSDESATIDVDATQQQESISFEPYMARTTRNTRATDLVDLDQLKAAGKGFGVFAYDQGTDDIITYNKGRIDPNFMFNEQVTWKANTWQYAPVKYWPNNPGDKVSFFAYAPYISDIMQIKGSPRLILEKGNVGPEIYYNTLVSDLDQALDLCWAADASTGMLNHTTDFNHAPVDFVKTPAYSVQPNVAVSSKIKFNFKHALSRLKFNVQIFNDVLTDGEHHGTPADGGSIDANTTITIKNLKLVGFLASEGSLSLYDGTWDADYETRDIVLLPYLDPTALEFKGNEAAGEVDLFGAGKYLTLIPNAHYKIEIEYWVETKDPTPGSHPLNSTVTKNIILSEEDFTLEQGKAYEFHLNLGMTTVKFDATVTDWGTTTSTEVDLPNNTH